MFEVWYLENMTAMVSFHLTSLQGCVHLDPIPALDIRMLLFSRKDWGLSEHGFDTSQAPR